MRDCGRAIGTSSMSSSGPARQVSASKKDVPWLSVGELVSTVFSGTSLHALRAADGSESLRANVKTGVDVELVLAGNSCGREELDTKAVKLDRSGGA